MAGIDGRNTTLSTKHFAMHLCRQRNLSKSMRQQNLPRPQMQLMAHSLKNPNNLSTEVLRELTGLGKQ
jgi:hypothetical protein